MSEKLEEIKIDQKAKEWLGEDNMLGYDIWDKKYRHNKESFEEWLTRVSDGSDELKELIREKKFLFGGRTLTNRGIEGTGNYFNCFSAGFVPDDYGEIMDALKEVGITFKMEGGQGISLSKLRPKGSPIGENCSSDGIIPFMKMFNCVTEGTMQGGHRRGALMISLDARHKEAKNFIKIKTDTDEITKANLSLEIDDTFMNAVKKFYDTGEKVVLHEKRTYTGHTIEYDIIPIELYKLMMKTVYDYAEPGCLFTNRFRNYNFMEYDDEYNIETCNPSLMKGTKVLTDKGVVEIQNLEGKDFKVFNLNNKCVDASCFLSGKNKRLYKIVLDNHREVFCTPEHKWAVLNKETNTYSKVLTTDLRAGDHFPLTTPIKLSNGTIGNYNDGLFVGFLYGDGCITLRKDGRYQYGFTFGAEKKEIFLQFITKYISNVVGYDINISTRQRDGDEWYECSCSNKLLYNKLQEFGVNTKNHLPDIFYTSLSEDFRRGFLDGIFSSDGSIDSTKGAEKLVLTTSKEPFANEISDLLWWYGVRNHISKNERKSFIKQGCDKTYKRYDVCIGKYGIEIFNNLITLTNTNKRVKLNNLPALKNSNVCKSNIKIVSVELSNIYSDVWDIHVKDDSHTFRINYCITGNCGEQPLKKKNSCNLGSINLYEFVEDKFTENSHLDTKGLDDAIRIASNALDDIIDENISRLPDEMEEYKDNAKNWRNIGLGVYGYADMLMALGLTYGSDEAIKYSDDLFSGIMSRAIHYNIKRAKDKGAFPKCDIFKIGNSEILQGHIDTHDWKDFNIYGFRNCSLLSIAPTGSIATMQERSGGTEPEFSLSYTRRTDNLDESYLIEASVVNDYRKITNNNGDLPDYFVTSGDIPWKKRINTQGIIQNHIDTAISSTVNLPNETPLEDVEDLYLYAWEKGLKGITIYRAGCKREGILVADDTKDKTDVNDISTDTNTKPLKLKRGDILNVYDDLVGEKRKLTSGCGSFHLETYFDELTAEPMETFINIGSSGSCERNLQLISRLMSLCLRAGVPIECIIDQCKSIKPCPAYVTRSIKKGDTSKGSSCPNAIGFALEELCEKAKDLYLTDDIDSDDEEYSISTLLGNKLIAKVDKDGNIKEHDDQYYIDKGLCPNCHEPLKHEGGCMVCNCGWSKCD